MDVLSSVALDKKIADISEVIEKNDESIKKITKVAAIVVSVLLAMFLLLATGGTGILICGVSLKLFVISGLVAKVAIVSTYVLSGGFLVSGAVVLGVSVVKGTGLRKVNASKQTKLENARKKLKELKELKEKRKKKLGEEKKRIEEENKRKELEEQKRLEEENKRKKVEEEKRKKEQEKKRLEEEKKRKELEEQKRLEEEKRRKELEEQKRLEEEKRRKELIEKRVNRFIENIKKEKKCKRILDKDLDKILNRLIKKLFLSNKENEKLDFLDDNSLLTLLQDCYFLQIYGDSLFEKFLKAKENTLVKITRNSLVEDYTISNKNCENFNFKEFYCNPSSIGESYVKNSNIYREDDYLKDAISPENTRDNLVNGILFLLKENKFFHQANTFVSFLFLEKLVEFTDFKKEDFSEIYDKISKALLNCFKEEKEKYIKSHYISLAVFATANSKNKNMENIVELITKNFEKEELRKVSKSFYDTSLFGWRIFFEEEEAQKIMEKSQIPELSQRLSEKYLKEYLEKISSINSSEEFIKFFEVIIDIKNPNIREKFIKITEEKYEERENEIKSINDYLQGKFFQGSKYKNYESLKEKILKILITKSLININRNKLKIDLKRVNENSQDDTKFNHFSREFELISLIKDDKSLRIDDKSQIVQPKFFDPKKYREDFLDNTIKEVLKDENFCLKNLNKIADDFHYYWNRQRNLSFNPSSLDNKFVRVLMRKCLLKIKNGSDKKQYLEKAAKLFENSFKDELYLEYSEKIVQEALKFDKNFAKTCLKEIFPSYNPNKEENSKKYELYLGLNKLITQ